MTQDKNIPENPGKYPDPKQIKEPVKISRKKIDEPDPAKPEPSKNN